jgi:hypothetical protein
VPHAGVLATHGQQERRHPTILHPTASSREVPNQYTGEADLSVLARSPGKLVAEPC